ncbi:MAG: hypothetical protein MK008_07990 [Bdellovibrionales bacterium]|nr:hypothetical protein [Bdellovibrionales bacterium]
MSKVEELHNTLQSMGAIEVDSPSMVKGEFITYAVTNAENILAIGQGRLGRLKCLMRGSRCNSKHMKMFVVGISNSVHGSNHRYFYIKAESRANSRILEKELHANFGSSFIFECGETDLTSTCKFLWKKVQSNLDGIPSDFEAVMEIVAHDPDALYAVYKLKKYHKLLDRIFDSYYLPPKKSFD